ncbi:hypothetical protein AX769_03890 [Frondihabitans sp. PAMC 28766]|uniref:sensor histidine kinase n=1 Tax=Frondihabitans sp. PAMC 28766 TaxID=1795630 RepID=UPI00078C2532|nr:histidine kinase [Frondihabitans sp. PAMC 28766]AMM19440.1 hypothetical protein AX769_03890 [Frondihabitans sp. PAMC 28766]
MIVGRQNYPRKAAAFSDRLLRPFLIVAFVAVVATQLVESHAPATRLGWLLFAPVGLLALWTLLPAQRTPSAMRIALLLVFAILSGILFAVPIETFSVGFVFLAALYAGQLIEARLVAIAVAVVAAVTCAASSFIVDQFSPQGWPWWLGLTAGLPVYIGIARRERAAALEAAQEAAIESERARLSEAREAALLERGRIAREIHDVLGHSLSAISIQLDMADTLYTHDRLGESIAAVRRARTLAKSGIGETRRAVHALNEDPKPLTDTIQAIASSFGATFVVNGEPGLLNVETSQTLIRAAQESLTNAHRHAPGADIWTELTFSDVDSPDAFVVLRVLNGPSERAGRDQAIEEGIGMGLEGMKERAGLLGGIVIAGPIEDPYDYADGNTPTGWSVSMRLPR